MGNHRVEFDKTAKYGSLMWVRDIPDYRNEKGQKMSASEWKCDCGNIIIRPNSYVVSGNTKSCGCRAVKHGNCKHPLYTVWIGMRRRCRDKNHKDYHNYGGRGIKVCNEWQDFRTFLEWGMRSGYKKGLTIDRIDVNGNYCPDNCRWATAYVQSNNTRSNHPITINGITKNAKQWADLAGIKWTTFQRRIAVYGMTPEEALIRQVHHYEPSLFSDGVTIDGVTKTMAEWSRMYGVSPERIRSRLLRGWDPSKAVSTPSQPLGSWVKKDIEPGTRFGSLVVVEKVEPLVSKNGKIRSRYKCVCDCGREKLVLQQNLLGIHPTTSCGRHECRRRAKDLPVYREAHKEHA